MRVTFTYKNGRERLMDEREALIMQRLGHGQYLTKVLRAGISLPPVQTSSPASGDALDALDEQALHALAKDRGIKVHHKAGADKVRAALRSAATAE